MKYINVTRTTHSIQGGRTIKLKELTDEQARKLLLERSHHIAISEEGKRTLFTAKELVEQIENAISKDMVLLYDSLSSFKTVKKAAERKLKQFGDE